MSGLPWQVDALDRFAARLARGQMPQALLVHGPEGVGRRHYALTVAARLLGVPWRPAPDLPADQLGAVPHPDYWAVGLEEESRQIKVDQIRDLARQLDMTSHGAGWKVGLICPAELMNHNAANTLLKTLEEPPPGTTLILVADSPAHLPPTIVSRCERVRLAPPAAASALAWLTALHGDPAACQRALAFACGAPLLARTFLAGGQGQGNGSLLAELADELQQVIDRKATPTAVGRAWARRDTGVCLRWLHLQTLALLRFAVQGRAEGGMAPLKIPGTTVNMASCCGHLDQILDAQRLRDRSLNMEAVFADLLAWWYGAAGAAR